MDLKFTERHPDSCNNGTLRDKILADKFELSPEVNSLLGEIIEKFHCMPDGICNDECCAQLHTKAWLPPVKLKLYLMIYDGADDYYFVLCDDGREFFLKCHGENGCAFLSIIEEEKIPW